MSLHTSHLTASAPKPLTLALLILLKLTLTPILALTLDLTLSLLAPHLNPDPDPPLAAHPRRPNTPSPPPPLPPLLRPAGCLTLVLRTTGSASSSADAGGTCRPHDTGTSVLMDIDSRE